MTASPWRSGTTPLPLLNNGLRRYADAVVAADARDASPVWSYMEPFVLAELIEGAVRTGQADLAREALEELTTLVMPGARLGGRRRSTQPEPC